jgi:hypothetical protein
MKMISTLAFTLLVTVVATAQSFNNSYFDFKKADNSNQSSLVIASSSSSKNYVVNINNRYSYNLSNNSSNITLNNLGTGVQYIEVIQLKKNIFGNEKRESIYTGNIQLKKGFETTLNINVFNQVNVTERQVYFDNNTNDNNNGNGCNNNGKRGKGKAYGHSKKKKGKAHCNNSCHD